MKSSPPVRIHSFRVSEADVASFASGLVHPVLSTFALTREVEWCGRLFVLDMKQEDEEGIGTYVEVHHHNPAFPGETVTITSTLLSTPGQEVNTTFEACVGKRVVATGRQGQKIIKKERLQSHFASLQRGGQD